MIKRFEVCYKTLLGHITSIDCETLEEATRRYIKLITVIDVKEAIIYDNKKKFIVIRCKRSKYESIRRNP